MGKKRVIVLGCTGSIGKSCLDVIRSHRDKFEITGLSAHRNETVLRTLAKEFPNAECALSGIEGTHGSAADGNSGFDKIGYFGQEGLREMIRTIEADIVVNGVAGSSGLISSITALEAGKDLALANKETIVMAGELILKLAADKGKKVLPVDSEHSALFFLTLSLDKLHIQELILTASGGAFRDVSKEGLSTVTLEDALRHPTWQMGEKITVDSATLANKGLEVIEAYALFNLSREKIKVVIHPQSCVHSLVRTGDGSLYAQISKPDMRLPIQNALTYPETIASQFGRLELEGTTLTFLPVDYGKYPMLGLAYSCIESGGTFPIVYNAANEVAVEAFCKDRIPFLAISAIVEKTLEKNWALSLNSFEQVLEVDSLARETARTITETVQ